MTWHVIRVRSKDAQKQLARTSLSTVYIFFFWGGGGDLITGCIFLVKFKFSLFAFLVNIVIFPGGNVWRGDL